MMTSNCATTSHGSLDDVDEKGENSIRVLFCARFYIMWLDLVVVYLFKLFKGGQDSRKYLLANIKSLTGMKYLFISSLLLCCNVVAWQPIVDSFSRSQSKRRRLLSPTTTTARTRTSQSTNDNDEDSAKVAQNYQLNNAYNSPSGQNRYSAALDEKGSFISRMLSPRPLPVDQQEAEDNEDGWSDMRKVKRWKKIAKLPAKVLNKLLFDKPIQEPGTLILVRHGER